MRHLLNWLIVSVVCAGIAIPAAPARAKVPGPNGQIVFQRIDRKLGGTVIYTMNPDGSHLRRLFTRGAEFPHWSPDGRKVSIFCCDDGMAAHIVDADTDSFRELAPPDPPSKSTAGSGPQMRSGLPARATASPIRDATASIPSAPPTEAALGG